jgi:hypothetical protein
MIRRGFLAPESRQDLIELTREGSAVHRLSRRANALVLWPTLLCIPTGRGSIPRRLLDKLCTKMAAPCWE